MGIQASDEKWLDLSVGEIQLENGYGACGRKSTDANG
jgi:hypothetical protein